MFSYSERKPSNLKTADLQVEVNVVIWNFLRLNTQHAVVSHFKRDFSLFQAFYLAVLLCYWCLKSQELCFYFIRSWRLKKSAILS